MVTEYEDGANRGSTSTLERLELFRGLPPANNHVTPRRPPRDSIQALMGLGGATPPFHGSVARLSG
jgi:hypothetical protein